MIEYPDWMAWLLFATLLIDIALNVTLMRKSVITRIIQEAKEDLKPSSEGSSER